MWGCELELKDITLHKAFIEHNSPKGTKVFDEWWHTSTKVKCNSLI
jgi:hypothetical protein